MTALAVSDLTKTYAGGQIALHGINLTVDAGAFFGLLGPNGAGKSTLIGIISTLVNKSGGTVRVFGHDLDRDPWAVKSSIGLVPQEFNFNTFETVEQIVVNQAGYYGIPRRLARQRAEHYLHSLGLWERRDTVSRTLSGGMKRRLMIARALMHEPQLLVLDEPTAGVDIELRRSMWDFLRHINDQGTTIILTTHYLEEAESLCKDIAIIDDGRIIENTDVKSLLQRLSTHAFLLDVDRMPEPVPKLSDFALRQVDDHVLEAEVPRGRALTDLFAALSEHGITVSSMRNKSNRLEELFLHLVESNDEAQPTPHRTDGQEVIS
ncbi:ABC transporter ATP-binding protein [Halorhodospira halophila]|uniref:ABC transporter related protein n=1 Tax=Halorhodospira halophila (strain DSM 244 / SL1) TaxID=349124 RepID=A1WXY0_HALHL|nr:ABC transporter ATP-binding protein [Halorhodospira halophila]ABM62542.1 ABC transporter related protein [Halorhodospira halophila SL1]MBK1728220.1 ABC transporter ATP-binding protein [Halorhodospira halophila]